MSLPLPPSMKVMVSTAFLFHLAPHEPTRWHCRSPLHHASCHFNIQWERAELAAKGFICKLAGPMTGDEKNLTGGSSGKPNSLKPLKQKSVRRRARSNLERSKKEIAELTDTLTKTRQNSLIRRATLAHSGALNDRNKMSEIESLMRQQQERPDSVMENHRRMRVS